MEEINIKPRIEALMEKKLVGQRVKMSMSDNKTFFLWQGFMPRRKEIGNKLTTELFSIQIYNEEFDFAAFNEHTTFEKWAAVEVSNFDNIPANMETYILKGGLYSVFIYKGKHQNFSATARYIYSQWLPNSEYTLDDRPHFEILGEKYKHGQPDSEEEVWIPIKSKQ